MYNSQNYTFGAEEYQLWKIFINICGIVQPCGAPGCQSDGTGNFYGIGSSAGWAMDVYKDPNTGTTMYDQGVTVTVTGGDVETV